MNIADTIRLLKTMSYTDERVLPANEDDQILKSEEWSYQLGDTTFNEAVTAYREMSRLMTSTPTIRDIVARVRDNTERQSRLQRQTIERQLDTNPMEKIEK